MEHYKGDWLCYIIYVYTSIAINLIFDFFQMFSEVMEFFPPDLVHLLCTIASRGDIAPNMTRI